MSIELRPLCTMVLKLGANHDIGAAPTGTIGVTEIVAAEVNGERFSGSLAGNAAADWVTRCGDLALIDVRMTIRADDGALVLVQYTGRLDLADPAAGIVARVAPTFQTGGERHAWLNRVQAVGKGRFVRAAEGPRIDYEFFEIV